MADKITIDKIANGYVVSTNYFNMSKTNTIHFKDMETLVKHLDECFVKPYEKILN